MISKRLSRFSHFISLRRARQLSTNPSIIMMRCLSIKTSNRCRFPYYAIYHRIKSNSQEASSQWPPEEFKVMRRYSRLMRTSSERMHFSRAISGISCSYVILSIGRNFMIRAQSEFSGSYSWLRGRVGRFLHCVMWCVTNKIFLVLSSIRLGWRLRLWQIRCNHFWNCDKFVPSSLNRSSIKQIRYISTSLRLNCCTAEQYGIWTQIRSSWTTQSVVVTYRGNENI